MKGAFRNPGLIALTTGSVLVVTLVAALYATVLGMSRGDLANRFDEIISFAEIGDFIDVPVKYYSSGMIARLAFAVAICIEPDILLLDEVLAVGDASFRQRCIERLHAYHSRGGTMIITSHDLDTIGGLCSRAIWLDHGKAVMIGDVNRVIAAYRGSSSSLTA